MRKEEEGETNWRQRVVLREGEKKVRGETSI
jgi:hypothetical protein